MNKTGKILIICISFIAILFMAFTVWLISKPTYKINVYEADTHDLVQVIENKKLIKKLIKKLDKAETISTAMWDMNLPEYKLEIMRNQNIVYNVGYYSYYEESESGQFYNYEDEYLYKVNFKLPIEFNRQE